MDSFRAALKQWNVEPPADRCDPYVTIVVTTLTTDWKVGAQPAAREVKKFVRGMCPPGTFGLPGGG